MAFFYELPDQKFGFDVSDGMNEFYLTLATVFVYMTGLWLLALRLKNNGIADIGWGIGFVLIGLTYALGISKVSFSQGLMLFLVALWAFRLSGYIWWRGRGKGEDFRYANWRKEWGNSVVWRSFLQVFLLQGAIMIVVATPIHSIFSNPDTQVNPTLVFGAVVAVFGIGFEAVADQQMVKFKGNPANKGQIMQHGLWKLSRHPNYFGEAVTWWGFGLMAMPSWWALVGPVVITFLLLRVSGVTLLEKKYEGDARYASYIKRTSAFVPWWPKEIGHGTN